MRIPDDKALAGELLQQERFSCPTPTDNKDELGTSEAERWSVKPLEEKISGARSDYFLMNLTTGFEAAPLALTTSFSSAE